MNTLTICVLSFLFIDSTGTAHVSAVEKTYQADTDRAMMLAAIDTGRTSFRRFHSQHVDSGFACEGSEWVDLGLDRDIGMTIAQYVGGDEDRQIDIEAEQSVQ